MGIKKIQIFILVLVIASLSMVGCQQQEEQLKLQSKKEKTSYAVGWDIGQDLKSESMEIDLDLLLRGFQDELSGVEPLLSAEEMDIVRETFRQQRRSLLKKERQEIMAKNQQEERDFLAPNSKKEGVVTLPSGLQYKIISAGDGGRPQLEDNVKVHYRGYFIDGTEFENSYQANQPAVFPVNRVILGWTEALLLMRDGAKWQLYIPAELAYGERGAGSKIGPNRMLVFELELLGTH